MLAPKVQVKRKSYIQLPKKITGPTKVKVGYPSGEASGHVINKAIWNHYGTSRGIPARPFLLNSMKRNRAKYFRMMEQAGALILRGDMQLRPALSKLGIEAAGDVQMEITATLSPPNAPSTIAAKGSSHPLIDTGEMRQATTWKVDD